MFTRILAGLAVAVGLAGMASAQTLAVQESIITDYRPVVGRIEASDTAMARARLQGVVTRLTVDEGQIVSEGEVIAFVSDDTLARYPM